MSQVKKAVWYQSHETTDKTAPVTRDINAGTWVRIEDYIPGHHALKVVRLSDGKPVRDPRTTRENLNKEKTFEQPNSQVMKTLPSPDGPIIEANNSEVSLRGSSNYGFFSSRDFGNIVKGPISFVAQPNEIRIGGMMTLNPLLMSGFPSTIVTQIPTLKWSLPSGQMLGPIAKDVALMSTLIGVFV
jgi:hypothetical protein